MADETMVALVQQALDDREIKDQVLAAGEFKPRGHSGELFVGWLTGGEASEPLDISEFAGVGFSSLPGIPVADAGSELPERMLIAVSSSAVYGFAAGSRDDEPTELIFSLTRSGITVNVHKRANVPILELIDESSGSKIELEGDRPPVTHSKDVIEALGVEGEPAV
jgi:hypothetical protein